MNDDGASHNAYRVAKTPTDVESLRFYGWTSQAGSGVETPAAGAEVCGHPLGDPAVKVKPKDWFERLDERLKFGPMWRHMPKHE